MRKWIAIWLMSLTAVAGLTAALVRAQSPPFARSKAELAAAPILSGSDIGFRVESTQNGQVIGTLMVRVRGQQWVEAGFSSSTNRLSH
jgi:hypothetical protein